MNNLLTKIDLYKNILTITFQLQISVSHLNLLNDNNKQRKSLHHYRLMIHRPINHKTHIISHKINQLVMDPTILAPQVHHQIPVTTMISHLLLQKLTIHLLFKHPLTVSLKHTRNQLQPRLDLKRKDKLLSMKHLQILKNHLTF